MHPCETIVKKILGSPYMGHKLLVSVNTHGKGVWGVEAVLPEWEMAEAMDACGYTTDGMLTGAEYLSRFMSPQLLDLVEELHKYGDLATGTARLLDVAMDWLHFGFDADDVAEWIRREVWDPAEAFEILEREALAED